MSKRRPLIALVVGASALAACQLFLDLDLTNENRPDAAVDGAVSGDPCVHAVPPGRPAADGTGDTEHDGTPLVFAVREFFFEPPKESDGVPPGWDLDGLCTCTAGKGGSCKSITQAGVPHPSCDDDAGRDLAGNPTFASYAVNISSTGTATGPNERIAQGRATMMFELRNYDGRADDRDVLLWMYPSRGILPTSADGRSFNYVSAEQRSPTDYCYVLADGGCEAFVPPSWTGTDRWTTDPTAFLPGGDLPLVNALTYVRDRTVYMQRDQLPIVLSVGPLQVTLTLGDAIVAGKVTRTAGGWSMKGNMHGRIALRDVIGIVGAARVDGESLCENTMLFNQLKGTVCALADVMSERALDSPETPCDALSLSIGFRAETAVRGLPLTDVQAVIPPCPGLDAGCGR